MDVLNNGITYVSAIKKYLVEEMSKKKNVLVPDDYWKVQPQQPSSSPLQNNQYDCGVFMCMYADFMLQNLPENFKQSDMPMLRRKICYCILTGKLLYLD